MIEQRNCVWAYANRQDAANAIKKLTLTFSPKKFLGISKPMASQELKGTSSTNPSEGGYFNVWAATVDEAADGGQIECHVVLDYITAFTEPKSVSQS